MSKLSGDRNIKLLNLKMKIKKKYETKDAKKVKIEKLFLLVIIYIF